MIDLDTPPPCPNCGATLRETEHPADEDGPVSWSYTCDACLWAWNDRPERLTIRTAPWTRALAAEVARLRAYLRARDAVPTYSPARCADGMCGADDCRRCRPWSDDAR